MRAREFLSESEGKTVTINIPITITIPSGNGDPTVSASQAAPEKDMPPSPVTVFPLQQELELKKHQEGKRSRVLTQILDDSGAYAEDSKGQQEFNVSESFEELTREYAQTLEEGKNNS